MEMWLRHGEAASAAALYSVYHGLYSEAVVASAVALAEMGRFREAVEYVQKAAKALYEAAKDVFEHVKITVQRLVELFVEAVARALAWVDEHKAYLFLMAAGVIALSAALNMWGMIELEKLAYAASAPFVAGLADAGGRAAERFRVVADRYEKWKMDERLIDGVLKAPLSGERPYKAFLKLAESGNLPKPLVELREALKDVKDETLADELVREAIARGWVDVKKAESWLEKLERGRVLMEGWTEYHVGLTRNGALMVKFGSTNPDNIEEEAHRLREMGLEEGRHFSVKMPEGGGKGYVSILRKGLEHAAWLSEYGSERQRELAAEFVSYILERAREAGEEVYEKAKEIVEEGRARGSLPLKGFEKKVEVDGEKYKVKVIDGGAEFKRGRDGRKLLRIKITAEVDGVRREYEITYGRYEKNTARGFAYASAKAPGGRETDAERFAAVIEALTGVKPRIRRRSDGTIEIVCGREHLDGFMRYTELADAIKKWLEETGR